MVAAIAALAGVALILANLAGLLLLHSYLLGRTDQQLRTTVQAYRHTPPSAEPDLPAARPRFMQNLFPELRIYVFAPNGSLVRSSTDNAGSSAPDLGTFDALSSHADGSPYTVPAAAGGDSWRVETAHRPNGEVIAVAVSLRQVDATADRLSAIDSAVTLLMLLLLGLAAASVVRLGLAPLTHMEDTAEAIARGEVSRRVEGSDPHTEVGRLGIALNGMLGQIESALAARTASEQRLRQFLADASHELRTPLTSIQGFAELYRRGGAPPGPALDEAMSRIESEAARMALLVADLMLLARLDQERPLDRAPVDLLAIAMDAVRDAHARVPDRFVRLDPAPEPPMVHGDEPRLRQVATNLIANALQHTPGEASITVSVWSGPSRAGALRSGASRGPGPAEPDGEPTSAVGDEPPPGTPLAVLEVVDTGPGMTRAEAAHVFERLYRADPSRSRNPSEADSPGTAGGAGLGAAGGAGLGGAGLGLAIVAAIVTAHGGRVELRTAPGAGAAFRALLPLFTDPPCDDAESRPELAAASGTLRA
ncbi:sensor histidine kinase [Rugosimonospora africana]|uniref:histidine kinase n=1 Tax=Rugosimonospora africana TaxID=556532 RepID=A0A8J3QV07_9ACTN|nr:HAMP domain-containing sensor histidine kinase [Rugosimonospora africana]GIH16537.1 two-component sensor histidine kinase [Rugosimonospora africana]